EPSGNQDDFRPRPTGLDDCTRRAGSGPGRAPGVGSAVRLEGHIVSEDSTRTHDGEHASQEDDRQLRAAALGAEAQALFTSGLPPGIDEDEAEDEAETTEGEDAAEGGELDGGPDVPVVAVVSDEDADEPDTGDDEDATEEAEEAAAAPFPSFG